MGLIYETFDVKSDWTLSLICKFLYIIRKDMIDANFRAISSLESRECCRKYSCTVNVAVSENIVAVTGKKVAVSIARSSCEGLPRSGNTVI